MHFYKNIRYLYLMVFFHNLIFAYVIERLFALERGMTVQLVVYTEIIYALVITLFVVPAGIMADKFGRKPLIVMSTFLMCLEFAVLIPARGFWLFGLSALIAGFGGSFMGGTWNSLLYDSLLSCGKQDSFEKILGRMEAVNFVAAIIAGLSGAFLAQRFGFSFNYWLSVISVSIAFLLSLKLAEPPKSLKKEEEKAGIREIISSAYAFFKTNPDVLRIVLNVVLIASVVNYVDEFWQIYLDDISFPLVLFGIVSLALTLVQIPGALLASKMLKYYSHQALIIFTSFLIALGIIWAAFMQSALGAFGIALMGFAYALMNPIAEGYLHRRADPNARATIESVESMMERILTIGVGFLFGFLSTRYSIFAGFWFLGSLAVFICVIFSMLRLLTRKPHSSS